MALHFPQFPVFSSTITSPKSTHPNTTLSTTTIFPDHTPKFPQIASKPHKFPISPKSSKQEENTTNPPPEETSRSDEMTELGMEIKKAMKERDENETSGLLSGVAEEIREIEWPVFNKVLGTTGVVLGVIAGSSVVLLTVNAVLAEISDRVFAGKGVQDFFG